MRLRNRKTGEVIEIENISFKYDGKDAYFDSLGLINLYWEDYKPAEPLIKDEKVCKLIRAWVDFTNNNKLTIRVDKEDDDTFCDYNFLINKHLFMRFFMRRVDGLESGEYTIAELCGEEEE